MQTQQLKQAVVYCRVSTKEQVDEGNSLATQERQCREYATKNGCEVVQVFMEQGESAKTADRTELKKLLALCADKKKKIESVIIYKLDRLSRNTDDYSFLRLQFKKFGVEIRSTSENFEDTPVGRFMENTMANIAQFDNDVRAERCAGGMKEAMREGRYVWMAPVGYDNVRVGGKATIAPNPVMAPIIRHVFELIAKNTHAIEDVRKIAETMGLRTKGGKPLSKPYFYKIFKNKTFFGMIEKFGESHKGLFEPVVSEELFNQVKRVLKGRGRKMSNYKMDSEDFPLRRFVTNREGRKLTGSWCKGRSKKYPFYRFSIKGSNYNRNEFESGYMAFMDGYRFDSELFDKLKTKLKEKLGKATSDEQKDSRRLQTRIEELTEKQNAIIKKNLDGFIPDTVLKQQLELIEKETFEAQLAIASSQEAEVDFEELLAYARGYLENPSSVWKNAKLDKQLKLQWFQFPQGITFDGTNYGTAQVASVYKTKEAFLPLESSRVVNPARSPNFLRTESRCRLTPAPRAW